MPLRRSSRLCGGDSNVNILDAPAFKKRKPSKRSLSTYNEKNATSKTKEKANEPERTRRKRTCREKITPVAVCTISSGSESEQEDGIEEISPFLLTSPPEDSLIMLDSPQQSPRSSVHGTESEDRLPNEPHSPDKIVNNHDYPDEYDSDAFEDIYTIDYKAQKSKVMADVKNTLESFSLNPNKKQQSGKIEQADTIAELKEIEEDNDALNASEYEIQNGHNSPIDDSLDSFEINLSDVNVKTRKPSISRKTKHALAELHKFKDLKDATSPSLEDSLLQDDIMLIEDNTEHKSGFRIRWGTKYIKLFMNKHGKFLTLYQQLADMYKVSISQIILSFNNKTVSPDTCPRDINFTIADILEGGVLSSLKESSKENNMELKFQSAHRKGQITIVVNKFDKFQVIKEKYLIATKSECAESKVKFSLDGETIDLSETPLCYDLEGGECIDVLEQK